MVGLPRRVTIAAFDSFVDSLQSGWMALECEVGPSRAWATGTVVDKPAVNLAGREGFLAVLVGKWVYKLRGARVDASAVEHDAI